MHIKHEYIEQYLDGVCMFCVNLRIIFIYYMFSTTAVWLEYRHVFFRVSCS
jgi:hypothetical protein